MVRSLVPKAALLLVLILLLVPPMVHAAEREARMSMPGLLDVYAQTWDFLRQVWTKNGLGLDPSGGSLAGPENGCRLDPSGHCMPEQNVAAEVDNGCRIDPNGGCAN